MLCDRRHKSCLTSVSYSTKPSIIAEQWKLGKVGKGGSTLFGVFSRLSLALIFASSLSLVVASRLSLSLIFSLLSNLYIFIMYLNLYYSIIEQKCFPIFFFVYSYCSVFNYRKYSSLNTHTS